MYVIAVLCMVKIYQTRHPDINATAYTTFGILAVAILLGMVGIFEPSVYFWVGFTLLHIIVCFYLTAQIYYMGCCKIDRDIFRRATMYYLTQFRTEGPVKMFVPRYKGKLLAGGIKSGTCFVSCMCMWWRCM